MKRIRRTNKMTKENKRFYRELNIIRFIYFGSPYSYQKVNINPDLQSVVKKMNKLPKWKLRIWNKVLNTDVIEFSEEADGKFHVDRVFYNTLYGVKNNYSNKPNFECIITFDRGRYHDEYHASIKGNTARLLYETEWNREAYGEGCLV